MARIELELFYDYQCSYSYRAIRWLDALDPAMVQLIARPFAQEQINRDPTATTWRLWEQPLDYQHHEGRARSRSLAAFLATASVELSDAPEVARRFRLAVFEARWTDRRDVSDPTVLIELAAVVGADSASLVETLTGTSPTGADRQLVARARIAADWAAARSDFAIFGVPTLRWGEHAPVYLRLDRLPEPEEGPDLFASIVGLRERFPLVLELKVPARLEPN